MLRTPLWPARALALLTASASGLLGPAAARATTAGPVVEVSAPANADQRAPVISWEPDANLPGGGIYLLVWEDGREQAMFGTDLYAVRVQPDGVEVMADAGGVNLLEAAVRPGDQTQASVVFAPTASPPVHLIAWTDPRNGALDIFATRFLTSTMSAIPSGGFQLTSLAGQTDAFPAAAFSGSTYFVAYQTNAGGVNVNGQRVFSDTTLDGGPVRLSGSASGQSPAIVAEGGRYVFVYETPFGDTRIGAVPDTGTIGAVQTSTLSTSTSAQSQLDIAIVGQDLFAVWQDSRNADRDIYGTRIDPATLMPRGADVPIAIARNNQLSPAVAGDAMRGLVVWQDRRNTSANAEIFATRLDANGAVRDARGFPIFSFNGNAFEATVEKGPGLDFLAAAVRFGQPSRLFFRVVRDEDPTGAVAGRGRLVVPADGVSTATVGFGVVQGPSGFTAVDGTLFDVTLSSAAPTVLEADADPDRAGLQLPTVNGVVQVSLRSTTREMVDVSIASVEGNASGQATLEFLNVVPVASDIRITPARPRSSEDLALNYTYTDVNGDPEGMSDIRWLRNDGVQTMFNGQRTVPASATVRGDVWRALVRPSDGIELNPSPARSSSVTIGNTPPRLEDVSLERDMNARVPTRTGDRVILRFRFVDPDLDTARPPRVRWTDRGSPAPALDDATAIPGSMVQKGQVWQAQLTPNDGFEDGPTVTTSTLTVVNTDPVARVGAAVEVVERRVTMLDGTMSSDVDPQDTLTYAWTQTRGPMVTLDDPTSATPSFTAPSVAFDANLQFSLQVSDGEATVTAPTSQVVDVRALTDTDADGLDDEEEMTLGTDPARTDTDGDELSDGDEVAGMLDPLDSDVDDDGLRDGLEGASCRNGCPPAPLDDADMDGVINARDPDSDDDGLPDGLELGFATPQAPGAGMFPFAGTDEAAGFFTPDLDVGSTTDPTDPDTDGDNLSDGAEDANANGRVDADETDPNDPLDPSITCTDDTMCPGELVCVDGTCGAPAASCDPLPDRIECCAGPCEAASPTTPGVCVPGSSRAQCPVDANTCAAGTCLGVAPPPPMDEGCVCARPSRTPPAWGAALFALSGLAWVGRRRRR